MNSDNSTLAKTICSFLMIFSLNLQANFIGEKIEFKSKNFSPLHEGTGHLSIHELNQNYRLYEICKNDIEGYSQKLSGGDYTYPCLREDLGEAMISRASTGKMAFEFLTATVPNEYSDETVSFFFYSDIDLGNSEPYDIFINDKFLLTFQAKEDGTLNIIDNPGKGNATYILVKRDHNNDGVGAFRLTVQTQSIEKGKKAKIKVQGHNKGSNDWFMLFKATDVIERLKISAETEVSFSIKQIEDKLFIDAPSYFANQSIILESDGIKSKKILFKSQGELAKASVKLKAPDYNFKIYYDDTLIEIKFDNNDGISKKSEIVGKYFYTHNTQNNGSWKATITKLYKPSFFDTFDSFFDKKHENGLVSIMNSSHQDIAWVDRPEVCIILRDTLLLTPVIKDALARNDYGFDIEDGLILREYLARHPDSKEQITTLLKKNLLAVGATYNCPYEDMYDAEDQVRQLYLGKKWVKKNFGGYDSKVYWNVDVPGKSLQTPQILKKAGVDYMVISRHGKGMFHWQSPDGSSVFTYSPGHYGNDLIHLSKDMNNKIKYSAEQVDYWSGYYNESKAHTPLLSSQDMLPAIDYTDLIETWNGFDYIKDENNQEKSVYLPEMELMTVDEFMSLAEKNVTNVDTIMGERPNVWVYIHGPAHHDAITASREASKLLPAAEKFLSISNILDPQRMPYPAGDFNQAWLSKIYPDHGWGGHDGDITDDLFKEHLVKSRAMGQSLLQKGTDFIASKIKTNEKIGIPVVLFNSLSWKRTDPVTVSVNLKQGNAKSLEILDAYKNVQNSQISNVHNYLDGSIKSADISFIAENIPSIGYKTYYVKTSEKSNVITERNSSLKNYENSFYKITFDKKGIEQVYDKDLQRNLFQTDNFKAADVFTLYSKGNGAGEFGDIQQPYMKDFDKVSAHHPTWDILADGSVFTTYRQRQQILHAIVEQDITIYHELKRVQFETRLLNWSGEMFREFRTAYPIAIENAEITYEVPFGSVTVGKDEIETAGDRYTPLCKDVHPRAIIDWISASDNEMTVTVSSSVAAADWIDPTTDHKNTVLQHLLLASRTSCHWEGNEYSQAGSHSYQNVLTSNKSGSLIGSRIAKQHNEPLHVTVFPNKSNKTDLPESASFFTIDRENVIITTVKKAEDTEDLIVRMYDTEGKSSQVNLESYFNMNQIQKTNIIEEFPVPVKQMNVPKYSIETFSISVNN